MTLLHQALSRPALSAALAAGLTLTLAGCGDPAGSNAAGGPIVVTMTDTTCEVGAKEAPAGTVEFAVTNKGTKVNEFYLYAAGDRIMGEVENVTPGLTRTLHVQLSEPGTYETACKPGMVGDGIRSDFVVTGTSAAPKTANQQLTQAVTDYQRWVNSQADAFGTETAAFVALVKAGKVQEAKAAYPVARSYWERIEPVAESFGDLDPKIDGREDVTAGGMKFTGYHRLERDLWKDGLQKDSGAIADQLLADVTELVGKAKTVTLNPLQLANGAKALLDEMATGKVTGEEERYSHTDLWDFEANFEGSRNALAALQPFLLEKDAALAAEIETTGQRLGDLLETHRKGEGFVLYTDLTKPQIAELTRALDAFAEPVAKVAAVVAKHQ